MLFRSQTSRSLTRTVKLSNFSNNSLDAAGIFVSSPALAGILYAASEPNSSLHTFSISYASALLLSELETIGLSFVPIHDRPEKTHLNIIEKTLRSTSSFPSGHVMGFSTLSTLLWYENPFAASFVTALGIAASYQRIYEGKHFLTDVVGSWVIGTSAAIAIHNRVKVNMGIKQGSITFDF